MYHRYAKFHELHTQLKKLHPDIAAYKFPPKKTLGNRVCLRAKQTSVINVKQDLEIHYHSQSLIEQDQFLCLHSTNFLLKLPYTVCLQRKGPLHILFFVVNNYP